MKTVLVLAISVFLAACDNIHFIKTGHFKEVDGVKYERQYVVIQTEPVCQGSCLEPPADRSGQLFDDHYRTYQR